MPEIVLECKPDETLINSLGYPRKSITHQPNKGQVINYLRKNQEAIGIIDDDPGSANPTYLSKFTTVKTGFDLDILQHSKFGTKIIVIKPRLEEWIIKYALESKINFQKHSLPSSGRELHKIINTRLQRFEDMIHEMIQNENAALVFLKNEIEKK